MSQAKWCTMGALYAAVDFLFFLHNFTSCTHTHTHSLSLSLTLSLSFPWSLSTHCQHFFFFFFLPYASVLPLGQQPSAKPHIKVLSAPSNLCCHLDVRSLQLPVPGGFKVQVLKVRPRSFIEEALLWHRTGNGVTAGNNEHLFGNNTQRFCALLSVWSCFPSVTGFLAVAFIALYFYCQCTS